MSRSRRELVTYAAPYGATVAQLVTQKAPALPESLVGSRLALVLHEIANSQLARKDSHLRTLAKHALAGYTSHNGSDVYTQIRDRLLKPTDVQMAGYERAAKIARSYNWHKVSSALDVDRELAKFIKTRGRKDIVDSGNALRQAHDAYGKGWEVTNAHSGVSQERREQVLQAMQAHLQKSLKGYVPATEITRDHVLRSLHRLAHGEHAREHLTTELGPRSKKSVTIAEPVQPAFHDTNKGPRVNPKRGPDQFTRRRTVLRYSATEGDVNNLLHQIATNPEHRTPGSNLRGVAADALQEQGREREANVLRNHPHEVEVRGGQVYRGYRLPQRHRDTALEWHGGGGSALYQIGSNGFVHGDSARRALEEIDDARNFGGATGLDDPNERAPLDRLYNYLSHIERDTADEQEEDEA